MTIFPINSSSFILIFCLLSSLVFAEPKVELGVDRLFTEYAEQLHGKHIGLITNHTGVNGALISTIQLFRENQKKLGYTLKALFAPEHGLYGEGYAGEAIASDKTADGIPIYSLHGATRRPTKKMLGGIDLLVFDIQDLGSRSYTFASTLYYVMEEAAKEKIPVMVLDRPNPINGLTVDGPMLEKEKRSFLGYINVAYCHGMTIGELARFFNAEYHVGCDVQIVQMKGWKREMGFADTGLSWIPTSPNIPEAKTAYFYPTTGFLGECSLVCTGVANTLPFRVVAAPWIDADAFADSLNHVHLPGVTFVPFRIKPFAGSFAGKSCKGVLIVMTDHKKFLPVTTQYAIMSALKRSYSQECEKGVKRMTKQKSLFINVCGTEEIYNLLTQETATLREFRAIHAAERKEFLLRRKKYLLYS